MEGAQENDPDVIRGRRTLFYIAQAVVWAGVILGCSLTLGSDDFASIIPILGIGAVVSLLIVPTAVLRAPR